MKKLLIMSIAILASAATYGQSSSRYYLKRLQQTNTVKRPLKITGYQDPDSGRFVFLNGYNFDFNGKLQSNYVGHLNIFKTYKINDNKSFNRIGVNAGITKIGYNGNNLDSTSNNQGNYRIENVLISPLDSIKVGTKYLRQANKYSLVKQNTTWSFYVQPIIRINADDYNQIFLHFHFELLVNQWTATTKITTSKQDTATISPTDHIYVRQNIGNTLVYKTTLLNGYFGAGLTFDLKISDKSGFFIQPTIGYTTTQPNFSSVDINTNVVRVTPGKGGGFYLVRANYEQKISKDLTVILGTDIRGLTPAYPPMYAAYVGVKLDVNALNELLKN